MLASRMRKFERAFCQRKVEMITLTLWETFARKVFYLEDISIRHSSFRWNDECLRVLL